MIPQQSTVKDVHKGNSAIFSPCRKYRYVLDWGLDNDGPIVQDYTYFVMLNPSTADAFKLDPTLRRCANYARQFGSQRMVILNLFAYRATKPKDMKAQNDPVGQLNDHYLQEAFYRMRREGDLLICGWGTNGSLNKRDAEVKKMIKKSGTQAFCLSTTKAGHPGHPLYLAGDAPLTKFEV